MDQRPDYRNLITSLLGMASLRVQERGLASSDKSYYLLPADLADGLREDLERAPSSSDVLEENKEIIARYADRMIELLVSINFDNYPHATLRKLVYEDEAWVELRELSKKLLADLGEDLEGWEKKAGWDKIELPEGNS